MSSFSDLKILCTSADACLGHKICSHLLIQQPSPTVIASCVVPEKVSDLIPLGARLNTYSPGDVKNTFRVDDAHVVILLPPADAQMVHLTCEMIEVCQNSGIEYLIFLTPWTGDRSDTSARIHDEPESKWIEGCRRLEETVRNSTILNWLIVRYSYLQEDFMIFASDIQYQKQIRLPIGEGKFSPLHADDLMQYVIKMIKSCKGPDKPKKPGKPGKPDDGKTASHTVHDSFSFNKAVTLTGPQSLSGNELAQQFSIATGTKISFTNVTPSNTEKYLARFPNIDISERGIMMGIFAAASRGELDHVNDEFKNEMNREARGMMGFVRENSPSFAPLK